MIIVDKIRQNLGYFTESHKDIYDSYKEFGKKVHMDGGPLDEKTRWLVKVSISATQRYEYALRTHIQKALTAGCTREEIEHAILLTAPSSGFPTMMEAIMILREELD